MLQGTKVKNNLFFLLVCEDDTVPSTIDGKDDDPKFNLGDNTPQPDDSPSGEPNNPTVEALSDQPVTIPSNQGDEDPIYTVVITTPEDDDDNIKTLMELLFKEITNVKQIIITPDDEEPETLASCCS